MSKKKAATLIMVIVFMFVITLLVCSTIMIITNYASSVLSRIEQLRETVYQGV